METIVKSSKGKKAPIILVTDERKEDWWWKLKDGRNMGPRQELVQEMMKEAKVDFHMYSSERFMSYGLKFLKGQINKRAIEELQEMARAERNLIRREKARQERRIAERTLFKNKSLNEVKYIDLKIEEIEKRINSLRHGVDIYKSEPIGKMETQDRIIEYSIKLQELNEKLNELMKERDYLITKSNYQRNFINKIDLYEDDDQ